MNKIARIHEQCVSSFPDGDFVIVAVIIVHNRHIVKQLLYRIEFHTPTAKAAQQIADEHNCDVWTYQTSWFTPRVEPADLPEVAFTPRENQF